MQVTHVAGPGCQLVQSPCEERLNLQPNRAKRGEPPETQSIKLQAPAENAGKDPTQSSLLRDAVLEPNRWVRFVTGSFTQTDLTARELLRRRLRRFLPVGALLLTTFGIRDAFTAPEREGLAHAAVWLSLGLCHSGLALTVWLVSKLSFDRLRWCELIGVALTAGGLGWAQLSWWQQGIHEQFLNSSESQEAAILITNTWVLPWFVFLVSYGIFLPNTWRRCIGVVGVLALVPVVLTLIGLGLRDPAQVLSDPLGLQIVLETLTWTAIGGMLAVYSSHKLETFRTEAITNRRLGQYQLHKQLGKGGMGEVYLAEHQLLRRPCAVKLLRPSDADSPEVRARFEREVLVTAGLTHWNTVEVFDFGTTPEGVFYYVMEYLPGWDLQRLVDEHGPLPPGRAVHLLKQCCAALEEAHRCGLVHRDIKPSNIMICWRGTVPDVVKVLDFGLVRAATVDFADHSIVSPSATQQGTILGTPAYLSPEQADGSQEVDHRSDIYSLGAVAYFLLTGQPPFTKPTVMQVIAAHLNTPVTPPRSIRAEIPEDLGNLVVRCLEKAPEKRFADVEELKQRLDECCGFQQWSETQAQQWWELHPADRQEGISSS